jgi:CheY-like chemotaxis protein
MAGPVIWIVEDERFQIDFLRRLFSSMFDGVVIEPFESAAAAQTHAATTPMPPDLIIVDLAIPDGGAFGSTLPGLSFVQDFRSRDAIVPIILRTGLHAGMVPTNILDHRTQLAFKGDSPESFVRLSASFLALRGFETRNAPFYLTPDRPVRSNSWLDAGWVVAAIPLASSLWVASALQVTSTRGVAFNSLMILGGILGGLLIAASRVSVRFRGMAVSLLIIGGLVAGSCALLIPPLASVCTDLLATFP